MSRPFSLLFCLFVLTACSAEIQTKSTIGEEQKTGGPVQPIPTPPTPTPPTPPTPEEAQVELKLSWNPPACRTDGTAIKASEIGGYELYYGKSANQFEPPYDIPGTSTRSLSFPVEASGTHYLGIKVYDTEDNLSAMSAVIEVTCSKGLCQKRTVSTPAPGKPCAKAQSDQATGLMVFNALDSESLLETKTPEALDFLPLSKVARCPAFVLKNQSEKSIEFIGERYLVSSSRGNSSRLMQCRPQEKSKDRLFGFKKVNLFLPLYRVGMAIKNANEKALLLPYDLAMPSNMELREIALKAGANEDYLKPSQAFDFFPLPLENQFGSRSDYSEKRLPEDFIVFEKKLLFAAAFQNGNLCDEKASAETPDTEDNKKEKSCYKLTDFGLAPSLRSGYWQKAANKKRIPLIQLRTNSGTDLDPILTSVNFRPTGESSDEKLSLFISLYRKRPQQGFYYSSMELRKNDDALPFLDVVFFKKSNLEIIRRVQNFSHPLVRIQAILLLDQIIKEGQINRETIGRELGNLVLEMVRMYKKQLEPDVRVAILDILGFLYHDQMEQNPIGDFLKYYLLVKEFYYSTERALSETERLLPIPYNRLLDFKNLTAGKSNRSGYFVSFTDLYFLNPGLSDSQMEAVIALGAKLGKPLFESYDEEFYINSDLIKKAYQVYFEKNPSEDLVNLFISSARKALRPLYQNNQEFDYVGIPYSVSLFILNTYVDLIFYQSKPLNYLELLQSVTEFLYSPTGAYMYSFEEATQKALFYLSKEDFTIYTLSRLQDEFTYWTSRQETFLYDKAEALYLAENTIVGNAETKSKFSQLKNYYIALRSYRYSDLLERKIALYRSKQRVLERAVDPQRLEFEEQILSWLTRELAEFFKVDGRIKKMDEYFLKRGFNAGKFKDLQRRYDAARELGKNALDALKEAENSIFSSEQDPYYKPVKPQRMLK